MPAMPMANSVKPFAPGTAEAVSNDHGNRKARALFQCAAKIGGGAVGIFRQEQSVPPSIDIRDIDAAVGAQKSVMRLGDQHAVLAADHSAGSRAARVRSRAHRDEYCLAHATDSAEGSIVSRSTMRPSALETILCLTTRMSPDWSRTRCRPQSVEQVVGERIAGVDFVRERDRKNSQVRRAADFFRPFGGSDPLLDAAHGLRRRAAFFRRFAAADAVTGASVTAACSHPPSIPRYGIFARQFLARGVSPGREHQLVQVFGIIHVHRNSRQTQHHARLARCQRRGMMRLEAVIAEAQAETNLPDAGRPHWCRVRRRRAPARCPRRRMLHDFVELPRLNQGNIGGNHQRAVCSALHAELRSPSRSRPFLRDCRGRESFRSRTLPPGSPQTDRW